MRSFLARQRRHMVWFLQMNLGFLNRAQIEWAQTGHMPRM